MHLGKILQPGILVTVLLTFSLAIPVPAQEQWRYAALGDSLATGLGATQGYVSRYQDHVEADNGVLVTLYNLGQNGWTSGVLLNALRTDPVFHNAIVLSEVLTWNIGLNDIRIARSSYKNRKCGGSDNQDCLRSAVATFKSNWDGIVAEILLRRSTANTVIRTLDIYNPWVAADKKKNTTKDTSEPPASRGNDFQVLKYYLDQMNSHIASTASGNSISLAGVYLAFNGSDGGEDPIVKGYIASDGLHPSDLGHEVMAALLRGLGYAPLR